MKSEERHELKRNDLAEGLNDLPALWARHGNKVLIVVSVALLAFAAVRYRNSQAAQRSGEAQQALASAWSGVSQVAGTTRGPQSPDIEKMRTSLVSEVNQAVQLVFDSSPNDTQAAWAWLARGEMYWAVAHADRAGATTAPSSQPATQANNDPRALAANAYNKVVSDFAGVLEPVTIARFSLAALAEEDGKLADARAQYKAITEAGSGQVPEKALAIARLNRLDTMEKPVLLLAAKAPAETKPFIDPLGKFNGGDLMIGAGPSPTTRPTTTQPAATNPAR